MIYLKQGKLLIPCLRRKHKSCAFNELQPKGPGGIFPSLFLHDNLQVLFSHLVYSWTCCGKDILALMMHLVVEVDQIVRVERVGNNTYHILRDIRPLIKAQE